MFKRIKGQYELHLGSKNQESRSKQIHLWTLRVLCQCYGTVPGQKFYENCILVENIVFWLNACVPIQDQS